VHPTRASALLIVAVLLFAADPALHVTELQAKKAAIERPAPEYPLAARQLRVAGKILLEAVVSDNGAVSEVRIVSGNPILTKAGVEALKKWRFKPFESGGKAVPALVSLSFDFGSQ